MIAPSACTVLTILQHSCQHLNSSAHPLPAVHLLCVNCCAPPAFGLTQHGARGYDKVEEYDPIERMKRLATGPAVDSMPSIEDELKAIHSKVDINKFDYKPVPRTDDDDEE